MTIFLTGFPSSGKTSLGKKVARKLKCTFFDSDHLIERICGLSCRAAFIQMGEPAFRLLESSVIANLDCPEGSVVALGGGAILQEENIRLIKSKGFILYLKVDKDILWGRLRSKKILPAYLDSTDTKKSFEQLYVSRHSIYEKTADATLHLSCMSEKNVVEKIIEIRKSYGQ
ncbi:MAG: shikimate kinase [Parachlamydiaceae bacterium]